MPLTFTLLSDVSQHFALHGGLKNLDTKVLNGDDCVALMKQITPEKAQQELQEEGSCDFGFAFGTQARFRVAIFRQRGDVTLVLRLIPNELLTFEQIGLPENFERIDSPPTWFVYCHWSNWFRQDNITCNDD